MSCFLAGQVQLVFSTSSKFRLGDTLLFRCQRLSKLPLPTPRQSISHPAIALHLQHLSKLVKFLPWYDWASSNCAPKYALLVLRSEDLARLRPGFILHFTLPFLVPEVFPFFYEKVWLKFFYNPITSLIYFKKFLMYCALGGEADSLSFLRLSFSWS